MNYLADAVEKKKLKWWWQYSRFEQRDIKGSNAVNVYIVLRELGVKLIFFYSCRRVGYSIF